MKYILMFIMGTIFGSFYNVVGDRVPNGESIVYPSSHCPKCNNKLKCYELIPILSFIIQKKIPLLMKITLGGVVNTGLWPINTITALRLRCFTGSAGA